MKGVSLAGLGAMAMVAAAPAAYAQRDVPGRNNHSPQLGTPGAAATGNTNAQIRASSGGGAPHAQRTGPRKPGMPAKPKTMRHRAKPRTR